MKLKKLTAEKGEKDFKPNNAFFRFIPRWGRKLKFEVIFTDSCYTHPEDPDYPHKPSDLHPWLKVCGMTNYFSENDNDSMLVAYRSLSPKRATEGVMVSRICI